MWFRNTIAAVALGAAALGTVGCEQAATTAPVADSGPKVVPVTIATAQQRSMESTIDVVGTLKGWEEVNVGAEKTGRVVKVRHDVGDRVKPGEALVELDTVNAELMIQQAERRLASELAELGLRELPQGDFDVHRLPAVVQAQVAVDRAERKFAREQQLAEKKVNTIESYQDAEFELRDRRAALDNAMLTARADLALSLASRVELDVARQARNDLVVEAPQPTKPPAHLTEPVEYAITKRSVSEGQMLREGDQVAHLIIDNPLRMWVNVPERFTPDVHVGQEVRLAVTSHPDKTFTGKVAWVNPSVDSDSRTFQIEVAVPNDSRELRPGGFVKAAIVTNQSAEKIVVPLESIVQFAGVTKIFVVRDNKAYTVPVETGIEGSGWVEIHGDVPAEAQVVVSGQTQLADGTPVVVRQAEAETAPAEVQQRDGSLEATHKPAYVTAG